MRRVFAALLLIQIGITSFAQDSISVLWIGNSYTYVNDLPGMTNNIALSLGDKISYDSKTNGGYTFQNHTNDPLTYTKINSKPWDYVVLQGQSQEPSFPTSQVVTQTIPFALQLTDSIYENRYCSQPMYYMTWGREVGDPQWDSINTFYKMNDRLRSAYLRMTDSSEASVSPVGSAWRYIRDNYPMIQLYSGDGSHPNVAGSYLTAATFYASLFRKTPVGASFISTLDPVTAATLQEAAALTVMDSLEFFHLRPNDETAIAFFSLSQNENVIQLTNESWRETSVLWNFGDGSTSTENDPQHTYSSNGMFIVQLIAYNECGDDTLSFQVEVSGLGLQENSNELIIKTMGDGVYRIEGLKTDGMVHLIDLNGREMILSRKVIGQKELVIDLSSHPKGMYIIRYNSINIKLLH
jgi:hypothetical protein